MEEKNQRGQLTLLIVGDLIAIFLVTLYGFASHNTLQTSGLRILTTLVPLLFGWFAAAPLMGVYDLDRMSQLGQLWRPFWAMVIAAPLAAWLRGIWLNAAIQPLFVLILGGFAALSILGWRLIFLAIRKIRRSS